MWYKEWYYMFTGYHGSEINLSSSCLSLRKNLYLFYAFIARNDDHVVAMDHYQIKSRLSCLDRHLLD